MRPPKITVGNDCAGARGDLIAYHDKRGKVTALVFRGKHMWVNMMQMVATFILQKTGTKRMTIVPDQVLRKRAKAKKARVR